MEEWVKRKKGRERKLGNANSWAAIAHVAKSSKDYCDLLLDGFYCFRSLPFEARSK